MESESICMCLVEGKYGERIGLSEYCGMITSVDYTFYINAFIFKLRSILEVDSLKLCIYDQTQKYTSSRLSK